MSNRKSIAEELGQVLAKGFEDEDLTTRQFAQRRSLLAQLEAEKPSAQGLVGMPLKWLATAAAVSAIIISGYLATSGPEQIPYWIGQSKTPAKKGQWIRSIDGQSTVFRFRNGSQFECVDEARARVAESNTEQVTIDLESGLLHSDVETSGYEIMWSVRAGPYSVHVKGTRFDVNWSHGSSSLIVSVAEGVVQVTGPLLGDQGMLLEAGNILNADLETGRFTIGPIQPSQKERPFAESGETESFTDTDPARSILRYEFNSELEKPGASDSTSKKRRAIGNEPVKQGADWRSMVSDKKYADAIETAERIGIDKLKNTLDQSDLWSLSNAARYARRNGITEELLRAFRSRFRNTPRSSTAAFLLAQVEQNQRHRLDAAHSWLEIYLKEAPEGPLAEEALARLLDVCIKSSRITEAKSIAKQYLKRFPEGHSVARAREVSGK